MEWLADKYVCALGIPLIFFVVGGFVKAIVRIKPGDQFWQEDDWFLGLDASLANLATCMVAFAELSQGILSNQAWTPTMSVQLAKLATFSSATFFVLVAVLLMHKAYEDNSITSDTKSICLVGISNVLALGLLFTFIVFVKGV